jgi:hypothetical protein
MVGLVETLVLKTSGDYGIQFKVAHEIELERILNTLRFRC